jgi:hypothetical protein
MPGPCRDVVGPERASLDGCFDVVVDQRRELSGQPYTGGRRHERVKRACVRPLAASGPHELKGLQHSAEWKDRERRIGSVEIIPVAALIELVGLHRDDRRRKRIDAELVATEHATHGVERSCGVQPVHVADEALIAERQLLAPDANGRAAALEGANVCLRET